jgi:hypothetical protein
MPSPLPRRSDEPSGPLDEHVLAAIRTSLHRIERLGKKALEQVAARAALSGESSDSSNGSHDSAREEADPFNALIDPESNSLVVIVRHMTGNMRSRWTNFLTTDGEKPTRNRDGEFDQKIRLTSDEVLTVWDDGWGCVFRAVEALRPTDLMRTVTIRGETHTVFEALMRQVDHYAEHVGQILFLAKHFVGANWKSLSIPRNPSTLR